MSTPRRGWDRVPVSSQPDTGMPITPLTGAVVFIGRDSDGLHHPAYDLDDAAIPHGIARWTSLVERALAS